MNPTRRTLLRASIGLGIISSIAGCSSAGADCETSAVEQGEGEALQQAVMRPVDDRAVLDITLSVDAPEESGIAHLSVSDVNGTLLYRVPVGEQRTYSIDIGPTPTHGVFRIRASDIEDGELDTLTIEFNCYSDHTPE